MTKEKIAYVDYEVMVDPNQTLPEHKIEGEGDVLQPPYFVRAFNSKLTHTLYKFKKTGGKVSVLGGSFIPYPEWYQLHQVMQARETASAAEMKEAFLQELEEIASKYCPEDSGKWEIIKAFLENNGLLVDGHDHASGTITIDAISIDKLAKYYDDLTAYVYVMQDAMHYPDIESKDEAYIYKNGEKEELEQQQNSNKSAQAFFIGNKVAKPKVEELHDTAVQYVYVDTPAQEPVWSEKAPDVQDVPHPIPYEIFNMSMYLSPEDASAFLESYQVELKKLSELEGYYFPSKETKHNEALLSCLKSVITQSKRFKGYLTRWPKLKGRVRKLTDAEKAQALERYSLVHSINTDKIANIKDTDLKKSTLEFMCRAARYECEMRDPSDWSKRPPSTLKKIEIELKDFYEALGAERSRAIETDWSSDVSAAKFKLKRRRDSGMLRSSVVAGSAFKYDEYHTQAFSMARTSGYDKSKRDRATANEDNGCAALIKADLESEEASEILRNIYAASREYTFETKRKNDLNNVGAVAASALLTQEGVAVRGAGDSLVLAIGRNGKVCILNELQVGEESQQLKNCLAVKGSSGNGSDFEEDFTWSKIEKKLGYNDGSHENDVRIVTVTDGAYGLLEDETRIKEYIKEIAQGLKVEFDANDYAAHFLKAARLGDKFEGKPDDLTVLSAKRPEKGHSVLLHALDGMGAGGFLSARMADISAKTVMSEVNEYLVKKKVREAQPTQQTKRALANIRAQLATSFTRENKNEYIAECAAITRQLLEFVLMKMEASGVDEAKIKEIKQNISDAALYERISQSKLAGDGFATGDISKLYQKAIGILGLEENAEGEEEKALKEISESMQRLFQKIRASVSKNSKSEGLEEQEEKEEQKEQEGLFDRLTEATTNQLGQICANASENGQTHAIYVQVRSQMIHIAEQMLLGYEVALEGQEDANIPEHNKNLKEALDAVYKSSINEEEQALAELGEKMRAASEDFQKHHSAFSKALSGLLKDGGHVAKIIENHSTIRQKQKKLLSFRVQMHEMEHLVAASKKMNALIVKAWLKANLAACELMHMQNPEQLSAAKQFIEKILTDDDLNNIEDKAGLFKHTNNIVTTLKGDFPQSPEVRVFEAYSTELQSALQSDSNNIKALKLLVKKESGWSRHVICQAVEQVFAAIPLKQEAGTEELQEALYQLAREAIVNPGENNTNSKKITETFDKNRKALIDCIKAVDEAKKEVAEKDGEEPANKLTKAYIALAYQLTIIEPNLAIPSDRTFHARQSGRILRAAHSSLVTAASKAPEGCEINKDEKSNLYAALMGKGVSKTAKNIIQHVINHSFEMAGKPVLALSQENHEALEAAFSGLNKDQFFELYSNLMALRDKLNNGANEELNITFKKLGIKENKYLPKRERRGKNQTNNLLEEALQKLSEKPALLVAHENRMIMLGVEQEESVSYDVKARRCLPGLSQLFSR